MKEEKTEEIFPIIDISCLHNKNTTTLDWRSEAFKQDQNIATLVEEIKHGFETWGFVYVKGHSIEDKLIEESFKVSEQFFTSTDEFKMNYLRGDGISVGYLPDQGEVFNKNKPTDLKELFDFLPNSPNMNQKLSESQPEFVNTLSMLFKQARHVALTLLRLLAVAMDIDPEYFVRMHSNIGDRSVNGTSMRTLYYPAVEQDVLQGQQRCGEHTDYGTITLLFQDTKGGLEVLSPKGNFVKAVPIPGAIVINAGDLMKCWSNGRFLSTVHRVTVPKHLATSQKARQSIAFFTHPDYDVTIKYKDEDGETKERNAYEHVKMRFDTTIEVK